MKETVENINDDNFDQEADNVIQGCLNLDNPKSFFLFAGAGSGKTGSLVNALKFLLKTDKKNQEKDYRRKLSLRGQRVAVITYTNAACDEIKQRLDFDSLIEVSTIHSFVWVLIKPFHNDIKAWLKVNLQNEIFKLNVAQKEGQAGKASIDRANKIASKTRRLEHLAKVQKFTYNPNGDNRGKDSLNHSEVISICADFLNTRPLMQKLLVSKYPIILVDESQDTNKHLMNALLEVQVHLTGKFSLGLFGDMMQRIYADGKEGLGDNLPTDWKKPAKKMNHRCPKRIVQLINKIRNDVDDQEQKPRSDKEDGFIKLFILPSQTADKASIEATIYQKMASYTGDDSWSQSNDTAKILILEHLMAARRLGFFELFEPLYKNKRFNTSLLDGTLSALRLFSKIILPLVDAKLAGNEFAAASIIRKHSPLVSKSALKSAGIAQKDQLTKAKEAVESLIALWDDNKDPSIIDILFCIYKDKLFEIPEILNPILIRTLEQKRALEEDMTQASDKEEDENTEEVDSIEKAFQAPFSQIRSYINYVNDDSNFDTHQGVKGREFPRVAVIMDDSEAGGFLFSYEKLFGAKEKTKTDIDNEQQGKDSGISRTRRLFYVTCSRAEKSLALIAYSNNPDAVYNHVINEGWFEKHEIEKITN